MLNLEILKHKNTKTELEEIRPAFSDNPKMLEIIDYKLAQIVEIKTPEYTHLITYAESFKLPTGQIVHQTIEEIPCYYLSAKRVKTADGTRKNISGKHIKEIRPIDPKFANKVA